MRGIEGSHIVLGLVMQEGAPVTERIEVQQNKTQEGAPRTLGTVSAGMNRTPPPHSQQGLFSPWVWHSSKTKSGLTLMRHACQAQLGCIAWGGPPHPEVGMSAVRSNGWLGDHDCSKLLKNGWEILKSRLDGNKRKL